MMYRCVTRLLPLWAVIATVSVDSAEPHSVQTKPNASPGPKAALATPTEPSENCQCRESN